MTRIETLIVEPNQWMARAVDELVGEIPALSVVGLHHCYRVAVTEFLKLRPRLVLIGLNLPDTEGLTLCRQIKSLAASTRVAVLPMEAGPEYAAIVRASAADAMIPKYALNAELRGLIAGWFPGTGAVAAAG